MCVGTQHANNILFQLRLVVDYEFGVWYFFGIYQVKNKLKQVKFVKEAKLGYYIGCFRVLSVCDVVLGQFQKIILVHNST